MRDKLPKKVKPYESAIINLDLSTGPGTHWVAYVKKQNTVNYYDSFTCEPPSELVSYWGKNCTILVNSTQDQRIDEVICGHLCLEFINKYGREYF